ncbi:4-(cytidine 5'-diphospho)-2-C-methyl-D-erythritol kinase [Sphingomonas sabuli]|uniref:4-diphosphocytidyl-2-C-methyl-D-erythritol kinase n=1 Tax=Sphingomonas sabuli TaxID=2764186 RepID=A0A7G9L444_9SPHN|nr:4-(cytidine 5'-diphospho)-2-C-methyl-D-erythritol kinase [Sphingomonas sabuli]QNM83393.1 4-(cytidine 5'-diphospho)-2-C-methyl-D-erythritol kinase [Sphingomonas sabuli]
MSDGEETAFAKLNLALHVRGRRADGFHDIETLFAFCEDGDTLTAEPADALSLCATGEFAEAIGAGENLVTAAAEALREASGSQSGAAIHLHKRLPVAGGIGGGSADAAAALRLLNRLWGLHWSPDRLEPIARGLGADVPACLHSTPMRGDGKGDVLRTQDSGLSGAPVLLVNPREKLSTPDVFAQWDGLDRGELGDWRHGRNDLESAAAVLAPQIGAVMAWLSAQQGVDVVRMSGSGPTCFALFETIEQRDRAETGVPREWWRLATRLR